MPIQTNFIEERWDHIIFTLDDAHGVMKQFDLTLLAIQCITGAYTIISDAPRFAQA
jgi:hypothetical protein